MIKEEVLNSINEFFGSNPTQDQVYNKQFWFKAQIKSLLSNAWYYDHWEGKYLSLTTPESINEFLECSKLLEKRWKSFYDTLRKEARLSHPTCILNTQQP